MLLPVGGFQAAEDPEGAPEVPVEEVEHEEQVAGSTSDDDDQDEPVLSEHVVVTANRTEQKKKDIPANVTVFEREDVEMTAGLTADDVVRRVPGFTLNRLNSSIAASVGTQNGNVRYMGGGAARTLVLMDGIPINDPYGGQVYWARVPKASLERVEVIRGAGSNVWGNRAMAGVISMFTDRPTERDINFSALVGQENTVDVSLFASELFGPVAMSIAANFFDSDGFYVWREDGRGDVDTPTTKQYGNFTFKLEAPISEKVNFFFTGNYFDEDHDKGTAIRNEQTEIFDFATGADLVTDGGNEWKFQVFANTKDSQKWDSSIARDRDSEELDEYVEQPASSVGTSAVWSRAVGERHRLMAGADWQWIDTEYDEFTEIVDGEFTRHRAIPGKQQLGGIFLQDIFKLSTKWQLTTAGRLDYISNYDGSTLITDSTGVVRDVEFEEFSETTFNPTLGTVFHANPTISWRAAVYRGFRAPTASELYRGGSARGGVVIAPNPALLPEHLVGIESGMDFTRKTFGGQITVFWTELQDRITNIAFQVAGPGGEVIEPCGYVEPDGVCRVRENIGEMTAKGVEIDLGYRPFSYWDFSLSYLYEDAKFTSTPDRPELEGLVPRHVPDHTVTPRVAYSNPRIMSASVQGRYVDDRFEDDNNDLTVASSFVVDLMFSKNLTKNVGIFAAVENVFDEVYEIRVTSRGLVEIGGPRWVYGGVRLAF